MEMIKTVEAAHRIRLDLPVWIGIVQQTLNARQDGTNVVGWAPSVLKNIETEFPSSIDIGVKHS